MTQDEIVESCLDRLPDGGRAQFDPLTLLILSAVISALIQWLVLKCLNRLDAATIRKPGPVSRWFLRRAIRTACNDPEVQEAVRRTGKPLSGSDVDAAYGAKVYQAVLATGASLSDDQIREFLGR